MKHLKLLLHVTFIFSASCSKNTNVSIPPSNGNDSSNANYLASNWSLKTLPVSDLYDIYFASNTVGFTSGTGSIFKTSDGGSVWSSAYTNNSTDFINLSVTPAGNVFVTTRSENTVYKSVGGAALTKQFVQSFAGSADIYFTGNDTGYISMASAGISKGLLKTINGGADWFFLPASGYNDNQSSYFSFSSSDAGYVTGAGLFYTKGQDNWLPSSIIKDVYVSVDAVNSKVAYISGESGSVYKTTDGGASFTVAGKLPDAVSGFLDIDFTDEQTGYVCNGNKIYKTIDGGTSWTVQVSLVNNTINEIYFTDGNHGWACGSGGVVLIYKL